MTALVASILISLPPLMPVSGVHPGQHGQCLTVFEGDTVEPVPFVVRGTMKNYLGPGRDLILIRLEGAKAEFTGVVAGMSGSPCSIDGKLIGALSYSFATFAKEPIAGVTPISGMLDVLGLPEEKRPWRADYQASAADWRAFRDGKPPPGVRADPAGLRPISAPLAMSGVTPSVRAHFEPWLRAAGFEPAAGGGAASATARPEPLKPGAAVSAVLVRGDVDIAATGTVSSVEGNEVLAFGHPFFGAGAVSLPMANATIVNTMVSAERSFKMAATGAVIGEVTQDRLTAIAGILGKKPAMIPVRGRLTTAEGTSTFSLEVARDIEMTPRFLAIGAASALAGRVDASDRGTVRFSGRIEAAGIEPVTIHNVYSAERDGNLFVFAAVDLAQYFATLWGSPFEIPADVRVTIDATYDPEPTEERVEAIFIDRAQVRPGDTVEVAVQLRRDRGGTSLERFHLPVPTSWAGQTVDLTAAGVDGAEKLANAVAGDPRPTDLKDVAAWLSRRRADGQLYLMAVRDGAGVRAGVETLPFLPPSIVAVFSGDATKLRRGRGVAWEERRARPGVVGGEAHASLKVLARQ